MAPERPRIAYVDGLRAVAVLIVVASHAWVNTTFGRDGVELFFVLSGFCLSYPTLVRIRDEGAAAFDVYRFAAKRIVRIVPPYWIAIVVLFTAGFFIAGMHRVTGWQALQQAAFDDYHVDFLTRAFWSLPVEFRWYFFFPVALWLWIAQRRTFYMVAAIAPLAVFAVPLLDLIELPCFMMGIVAAHMTISPTKLNRWALPLLGVLLAAFCIIAPLPYAQLWNHPFFLIVAAFMGFLLVIAAADLGWLKRALSMRWLVAVGVASYSIYLVHDPIVRGFVAHGWPPAVASLIAIAAGFAFWAIAERPFVENAALRDGLISLVGRALQPVSKFKVRLNLRTTDHGVVRRELSKPRRRNIEVGAVSEL